MSKHYHGANKTSHALCGGLNGDTIGAAATGYNSVVGNSPGSDASEDGLRNVVPFAGTIKNLHVQVNTNTLDVPVAFTIRLNGAATALTTSITAAATGTFSDTTNSFKVVAGDVINTQHVTAAGTGSASQVFWAVEFIPD